MSLSKQNQVWWLCGFADARDLKYFVGDRSD